MNEKILERINNFKEKRVSELGEHLKRMRQELYPSYNEFNDIIKREIPLNGKEIVEVLNKIYDELHELNRKISYLIFDK